MSQPAIPATHVVGVGSYADVMIFNALVLSFNDDESWAEFQVPAGKDDSGAAIWLPFDSRIQVNEIAPKSWPPLEGDIWEANGVTMWTCAGADGVTLYFVTEDNIRTSYMEADPPLPLTIQQALAQYGNALALNYRP